MTSKNNTIYLSINTAILALLMALPTPPLHASPVGRLVTRAGEALEQAAKKTKDPKMQEVNDFLSHADDVEIEQLIKQHYEDEFYEELYDVGDGVWGGSQTSTKWRNRHHYQGPVSKAKIEHLKQVSSRKKEANKERTSQRKKSVKAKIIRY